MKIPKRFTWINVCELEEHSEKNLKTMHFVWINSRKLVSIWRNQKKSVVTKVYLSKIEQQQ